MLSSTVPEGPVTLRTTGPLAVVVVGLTVVVVLLAVVLVVLVGWAVVVAPCPVVVVAPTVVVADSSAVVVTEGIVVLPACSCWILSCRESVLAVVDSAIVLLVWPLSPDAALEREVEADSSVPPHALSVTISETTMSRAKTGPNLTWFFTKTPMRSPSPCDRLSCPRVRQPIPGYVAFEAIQWYK